MRCTETSYFQTNNPLIGRPERKKTLILVTLTSICIAIVELTESETSKERTGASLEALLKGKSSGMSFNTMISQSFYAY